MYFLIPKNAKFIYFKSSLCISILLLCLTPVIGSMLQTRVHSTQYTADTVHTTAVASREQWKVSTGSLATLLRHYHITFVTSLSLTFSYPCLPVTNLRLRACVCLAPPPVSDVSVPRRLPTLSVSVPVVWVWHPPTAAWRPAATCNRGAARCRDLQSGCSGLQLCIHWTHPAAGGFHGAAEICMNTDAAGGRSAIQSQ